MRQSAKQSIVLKAGRQVMQLNYREALGMEGMEGSDRPEESGFGEEARRMFVHGHFPRHVD